MAKATTPRYVLPSHGVLTYEFPIVAEYARVPAAYLAVEANTKAAAITLALEWCRAYSAKHGGRFFPRIMVPHSDGSSAMLVKRVDPIAYAWVENNERGQWVPVDGLR